MDTPAARTYWRRCSTCKQALDFGQKYWVCNVSTCNRKRTGLVFCTVECWDAHVPMMNHRESWAEERVAPSQEAAEAEESDSAAPAAATSTGAARPLSGPNQTRPVSTMTMGAPDAVATKRRIVGSTAPAPTKEVLVVASKVKDYIREKAEMNTSQAVMDVLSEIVRAHCEDAIQRAREDGRKTVLDRDFRLG